MTERRLRAVAGHLRRVESDGCTAAHGLRVSACQAEAACRSSDAGVAVLVGASIMDVQARAADGFPLAVGTSVPGSVSHVPGGVARNIAAALAALRPPRAPPPLLVSCVGNDAPGDALVRVRSPPYTLSAGHGALVLRPSGPGWTA
jgi:hypothetical protein